MSKPNITPDEFESWYAQHPYDRQMPPEARETTLGFAVHVLGRRVEAVKTEARPYLEYLLKWLETKLEQARNRALARFWR